MVMESIWRALKNVWPGGTAVVETAGMLHSRPRLRGQMTIIGITMSVIALVMYVALLPVMEEMINVGINSTNNSTIQLLLPFLPVVMLFGIIITMIMYTTANR